MSDNPSIVSEKKIEVTKTGFQQKESILKTASEILKICNDIFESNFETLEQFNFIDKVKKIDVAIKSILKDCDAISINVIETDGFIVNENTAKVSLNGKEIYLTKKEFHILTLLLSNKNKVFSREAIMGRLWDANAKSYERTVDVHIAKLRGKLRKIENKHNRVSDRFKSIKGRGYSFNDQEEFPKRKI